MCDRNCDFSSSARRRWSARSSSSAYSATTPRLVSCSSWLSRSSSSWRAFSSSSWSRICWFCWRISSIASGGPSVAKGSGDRASVAAAVTSGARRGRILPSRTVVPPPGLDSTCELVHQALRAQQADAHAGGRLVRAGEDRRADRRCPGPLSRDDDLEALRRGLPAISRNSTWPPPAYSNALRAISETAVVMRVWSCASKPTSSASRRVALAHQHDVRFRRDRDQQQARVHAAPAARPHRDHRGVVAAAAVVAQQHAGDQAGMLAGQPGIARRDPSAPEARPNAGSAADCRRNR